MRTPLVVTAAAALLCSATASPESRQEKADRERRLEELERCRAAAGGIARALPPRGCPNGQGARRHVGFSFRPDFGLGHLSVTGSGLELTGTSWSFGLHAGGAIKENLIVGVHAYNSIVVNPKPPSPMPESPGWVAPTRSLEVKRVLRTRSLGSLSATPTRAGTARDPARGIRGS